MLKVVVVILQFLKLDIHENLDSAVYIFPLPPMAVVAALSLLWKFIIVAS